jgi:hypothetical protein
MNQVSLHITMLKEYASGKGNCMAIGERLDNEPECGKIVDKEEVHS